MGEARAYLQIPSRGVKVTGYASEVQYLDHLAPIWHALVPAIRDRFYVRRSLLADAERHGIEVLTGRPIGSDIVMVAAFQDHQSVHRSRARTRTIFVEHGAGQSYLGDPAVPPHPSYSGGHRREGVALFIVPNETIAERNRMLYPETPNAVVGCPKLDRFHRLREHVQGVAGSCPSGDSMGVGHCRPVGRRVAGQSDPRPWWGKPPFDGGQEPTVAISFHCDIPLLPETRWAFPHFEPALSELAGSFNLIGHGHPRAWRKLRETYERLGIESVQRFDEVLERADVYVIDNSSTALEFMSIGKPVVWMNAPWYRREVNHGGRFWDWAEAGVQVDRADGLVAGVERALQDPLAVREIRERVVRQVYPYRDGRASTRAAAAIQEFVDLDARSGSECEPSHVT